MTEIFSRERKLVPLFNVWFNFQQRLTHLLTLTAGALEVYPQ
jgi:hypothetical protein